MLFILQPTKRGNYFLARHILIIKICFIQEMGLAFFQRVTLFFSLGSSNSGYIVFADIVYEHCPFICGHRSIRIYCCKPDIFISASIRSHLTILNRRCHIVIYAIRNLFSGIFLSQFMSTSFSPQHILFEFFITFLLVVSSYCL